MRQDRMSKSTLASVAGVAASPRPATIGNGTNLAHDRAASLQATRPDPKRSYVGFIGNLAPWQGLDLALAAFGRLAEQYPTWQLIIAGDGPEKLRLETQARRFAEAKFSWAVTIAAIRAAVALTGSTPSAGER